MKILKSLFALLFFISLASPVNALSDINNDINEIIVYRENSFILYEGNLIEVSNNNTTNMICLLSKICDERITLGTITWTIQQTKDVAYNIQVFNNPLSTAIVSVFGISHPITAYLIYLSANAQFKSDIIYAAEHNLRIKVIVTDSKYCHTSYSTILKYQVIN